MAAESAGPVIVWFRQDLRLRDNPALSAAAATGRPVIPLFILGQEEDSRPWGAASLWWLDKSLAALAEDLKAAGSRLVLRRGRAAEVIAEVVRSTGASGLYMNRLYDAGSRTRDAAIQADVEASGAAVESFNASLLHEPGEVCTGQGGAYKVFTAYWKQARRGLGAPAALPAPRTLEAPAHWPASEALSSWKLHPTRPDWSTGFDWTAGEAAAEARLDRFIEDGLSTYSEGRDRPAIDGSSRLSPHLHWGEISPRQIHCRLEVARHSHAAPDAQIEKFLAELGWRDFNHQLLASRPELPTRNLDARFDRFPWRKSAADERAWKEGRTGYPLVDAAMRQMWSLGWMHNRMRMVAASFLIKHLLIDWRVGEAWFWDCLVDADLANNTANWQWVAGSGADAQPFFRIFNPVTQGERHDPQGDYVRRWVPELAGLPGKAIHSPWSAKPEVLARAGVVLGRTYPRPIIDHGEARKRALDAFRAIAGDARTRA